MSFISSIPDVAVVVVIFKGLVEDEVRDVVAGLLEVGVQEDLVVEVRKELVGDVQGVEDVQVDVVGDVQADAQVVLGVQEVVVVDVEVKR